MFINMSGVYLELGLHNYKIEKKKFIENTDNMFTTICTTIFHYFETLNLI